MIRNQLSFVVAAGRTLSAYFACDIGAPIGKEN